MNSVRSCKTACFHLEKEEEEEQEAEVVAAEQVELPHRAKAGQQQSRQRPLQHRVQASAVIPTMVPATTLRTL
jgi:hypothetical protein